MWRNGVSLNDRNQSAIFDKTLEMPQVFSESQEFVPHRELELEPEVVEK